MKKTIIKQLTNLSDFFVSGCCFGMSSEFKIPEKLKNVLPVPVSRTIPLIINLFNLIIKAAQACRIYILPSGCIEHYYYKTKVDYMPVSAKDKLFHIEYDYLCNATPKQLKKSYPKLIEILEKACKI